MKTNINKIFCVLLSAICIFLSACNEEWTDEQFEKSVSFVKAGDTNVYIKYAKEGGVVPYKIPVVLSGSTKNDQNVEVTIAVDLDTLSGLNEARFRNRTDLYFKLLEAKYYTFSSMKTVIPKGENVAVLDINFNLSGLDLVDKYILPLQITETSAYQPSARKWEGRTLKKTLMRIIPFNDYSGTYKPSGGNIVFENDKQQPKAGTAPVPLEDWREARVVDENTIFFYAGFVEEQASDRTLYKIRARFNDDFTITLTADHPDEIKFSSLGGSWRKLTETDEKIPYLEYQYVIMDVDYRYSDVTNPNYIIPLRVTGSYTMGRTRNTKIPEEDQQIIW